jgi:hypothetical protein
VRAKCPPIESAVVEVRIENKTSIDITHLVSQLDPGNTLGIPEKLVHIIVTDDLFVISFTLQELAVDDLVRLITQESVQRLNNTPEIKSLGNRLHPVLTFWRPVIVVCALEDEAETFRHESDLGRFTPTEEEKGNLSKTIVLRHVVHCRSPSVDGGIE